MTTEKTNSTKQPATSTENLVLGHEVEAPTNESPLRKSRKFGSLMPSRSVLKVRSVRPSIIGLKTKKED